MESTQSKLSNMQKLSNHLDHLNRLEPRDRPILETLMFLFRLHNLSDERLETLVPHTASIRCDTCTKPFGTIPNTIFYFGGIALQDQVCSQIEVGPKQNS